MKIGEFAKQHHVSIDMIRHYMDLELLLPEKQGSHYAFGKKDNMDLLEILAFKKMNFSLTEIQKIFAYKRLTAMTTSEDQLHYKHFLEKKKGELLQQQKDLERTLGYIEEKIKEIRLEDSVSHSFLGMPLSFLTSIYCPLCDKSLPLMDGHIENNLLMEGDFQCSCGYCAKVFEGIFISLDDQDKDRVIPIDTTHTTLDYVMNTSTKFINFMYRAINMVRETLQEEPLENAVILEVGTGSGLLIRQLLTQLPPNALYIITDHDRNRIQHVKDYLERESLHKNFVFLCTDFEKLPLANTSVDYILDYWGSVNYNLKATKFLPQALAPKLKAYGKYLGVFIYFTKLSQRLKHLSAQNRRFYHSVYLEKLFTNTSYSTLAYKELGTIDEAGIYEPLIEGGTVSEVYWCGKKRS
jgi:DNA-binding transcriptional MerR regulator